MKNFLKKVKFNKLDKVSQGFTLVELLIVVSILASLVVVGAPLWREARRSMILKSDAQLIMAEMQWAKSTAARRNACVSITFTTRVFPATGGTFRTFLDDGGGGGGSCNRAFNAGETIFRDTTVDPDVSLVSAAIGGGNTVCFTRNAVSCGSQFGNIQVRNANTWYRIVIAAAGGLQMQRSSDGNVWQ